MNQAYIEAFLKRAAEYGVPETNAIALFKAAADATAGPDQNGSTSAGAPDMTSADVPTPPPVPMASDVSGGSPDVDPTAAPGAAGAAGPDLSQLNNLSDDEIEQLAKAIVEQLSQGGSSGEAEAGTPDPKDLASAAQGAMGDVDPAEIQKLVGDVEQSKQSAYIEGIYKKASQAGLSEVQITKLIKSANPIHEILSYLGSHPAAENAVIGAGAGAGVGALRHQKGEKPEETLKRMLGYGAVGGAGAAAGTLAAPGIESLLKRLTAKPADAENTTGLFPMDQKQRDMDFLRTHPGARINKELHDLQNVDPSIWGGKEQPTNIPGLPYNPEKEQGPGFLDNVFKSLGLNSKTMENSPKMTNSAQDQVANQWAHRTRHS